MAIVIDRLSIGELADDTAGTTVAFNTSQTVASNGFIVLSVTWIVTAGQTLSTVSGGGLTWAIDKQGGIGGAGQSNAAIISAQAPAGLASGTTITATYSASTPGARAICGTSFTGVLSAAALDTTNGPTLNSGTAWATGSTTLLAGSVLVACSVDVTDLHTSTVTAPSVEAHDFGDGGFAETTCYQIGTTAGSYTVAGTWSSSATGLTNAAAYKAAPTAADTGLAWIVA
jgi:hypothetical protein